MTALNIWEDMNVAKMGGSTKIAVPMPQKNPPGPLSLYNAATAFGNESGAG
eukprot:CAMPEP_0184536646 /NCGR_PEP_ID=MMETSP0198_2-20121128/16558_1 /TAXON_ID=1112570 /ORGANISM="Thraustochytrium sp., Strain LLF1b" /LENGTH=50 /DNA_ID=CAMNT_0026929817 /DNA_START=91 /DNA_END=242 /DNA_ORIENTATION=+